MNKKKLDCGQMPGSRCSLVMIGTETELMKAGVEHAVSSHGHKDTADFRSTLRKMMQSA